MATLSSQAAPLPPRLMNFFTRYPPSLYSARFTGASYPLPQATARSPASQPTSSLNHPTPLVASASNTSSDNSDAPTTESTASSPSSAPKTRLPNPFLPWKNPRTGRWRGAAVPLRRQADLVKLAKQYGVESLLPPGRKSTVFKEERILQKGLRVKGTGEGQKVKGHKWERTMNATVEKRRQAMECMPEMIRLWKQVSSAFPGLHPNMNVPVLTFDDSEDMEEGGRSIPDDVQQSTLQAPCLPNAVGCHVYCQRCRTDGGRYFTSLSFPISSFQGHLCTRF